MKQLFLSLIALVALTMVSCGPDKTIEANKAIYTESIISIDSIQDLAGLQIFQEDFIVKENAFNAENEAAIAKFTEEDKQAIETLKADMIVKLQQKANTLVQAQMSSFDSMATPSIEAQTEAAM